MDSTSEPEKAKNWTSIREWANLFVGGASLIVAIVAIWITAQISGLEDYLRSEVALRNTELNSAANDARALDESVKRSEARLEELRAMADRLTVSSNEAQTSLADAQGQSIALLTEQRSMTSALSNSRSQLEAVQEDIELQTTLLTNYRRDEVLSRATQTFSYLTYAEYFRTGQMAEREVDGPFALSEMRNFGVENRDPAKQPFFEAIRTIGPSVCRRLETFTPEILAELPYPALEGLKGKRTERGTVLSTNEEIEAFYERRSVWSEARGKVSKYNRSLLKARLAADDYIRNALWHCSCVAVKDVSTCQPMPDAPNIGEMMGPRP